MDRLMIVKLIIHKNMQEISIWNKEGDRLYYSDVPKDVDLAKKLLTVIKRSSIIIRDGKTHHETEQRMSGYFNAKWVKKICTLVKRAEGYTW